MKKCKGRTAKNVPCNRVARDGDFCHSHQGQMSDQPSDTLMVQSVASSVTPSLSDVREAIESEDRSAIVLKPFISRKQLYHVWKQAKAQAQSAKVDFPYTWAKQKEQIADVVFGITRDDAKKALDAAFDKASPDRSLCHSLFVSVGIKDIPVSIQGKEQEVSVAQRQAPDGKVPDTGRTHDPRIDQLEAMMAKLLSKLG